MPKCDVCDSEVTPEQKTCHVCGSPTSNDAGSLGGKQPVPPQPRGLPANGESPPPAFPSPTSVATDQRHCPACRRLFDASFTDDFCPCGTELLVVLEPVEDESPELPLPPIDFPLPVPTNSPTPITPLVVPNTPIVSQPDPASNAFAKPAAGTVCLVLYSDTKPRQPLKYFALTKDITLIGRLDAVSSVFPDVDLSAHLDSAVSRKVSRKHAEILRSRTNQTFQLKALPGNTGTQVGKELVAGGQDVALTEGTPIVLGGGVWLKFETVN